MNRQPLSTRSLAAGSFAGLAAFPLTVVALNLIQHGRYHPLRQAMSELALGRDGWLMTIAFAAMGVGTLLLALLLRRTAGALVAPLLLSAAGLLDFVSASFHTDPGNVTTTMHGRIHNTAGIATFALFVVAIFAATRSFRRHAACAALRREVFDEVGGFSETLPVNFNDVDLSYKVRFRGYRIVFMANCELYHFESRTSCPWNRALGVPNLSVALGRT